MTELEKAQVRSILQIAIDTSYIALKEIRKLQGEDEEHMDILDKNHQTALDQIDDFFGQK